MLLFAAPTIGTVLIAITYDIIDGFFVSNYIGKTAFAAVNIIYPFQLMLSVIGYMFGTGGSALVASEMGRGRQDRANQIFTMLVKTAFLFGTVLAVFGFVFLPEIAGMIGATQPIMEYGLPYGRTLFIFLPVMIVGYAFQSLLITAEKPQFGLYLSIANMISNIIFDYLFIVVFGWGMVGAAVATGIGACLNGIVPLIYFSRDNSSKLHFTDCHFERKALLETCFNGLSEMVEDMAMSFIFVFYNMQLLRFMGEDEHFNVMIFPYLNSMYMTDEAVYYYRYGGAADNYNRFFPELLNFSTKRLGLLDKYNYSEGYQYLFAEYVAIFFQQAKQLIAYNKADKQGIMEYFKNEMETNALVPRLIEYYTQT